MTNIPATLTDFAKAHWTAEAVPAATLDVMRLCLLDWAIGALAAHDDPLRAKMQAHVAGAPGPAPLLFGGTASPRMAALHNGTLSHALDFDDTHFAHIGHVSTVVIPAALATGNSLDDVLVGARLGAEVATRIGLWLGRSHYQVGYHQTATAGAFGAVVATIRAGGQDPDSIAAATRIVSGMTAGLKAQFGTAMKPMNAGFAAAHGVEAAELAVLGLDGSDEALPALAATHHGEANGTVFATIGTDWLFDSVSHKFHACCHGTHAAIEAIREGIADLASPAKDVQSVTIRTHPRWMSVCNKPDPQTALEEKFSYRFLAALTLAGGNTLQVDAVRAGGAIPAAMTKIEVLADDGVSETATKVQLTLASGEVRDISHDLSVPQAYPARLGRILEKGALTIGASRSEALWEAIQSRRLSEFTRLLGTAPD